MHENARLLDIDEDEDDRLSTSTSRADDETRQPRNASSTSVPQRAKQFWAKWRVVILCCLLLATLGLPQDLVMAPSIELMELAICRGEFGEGVDRDACKNSVVQGRLANLRGVLAMLMILPSLVLAVPYGMLADRKGKRFVISLTVISAICCYIWNFCVFYFYYTLPFWLIYLYPLFLWLGGGGFVAISILSALAADVVPPESLTRVFFLFGVVGKVVEVVAPLVGAAIMKSFGPYTAFFVSIPLSFLPFIPLDMMPETSSSSLREHNSQDDDLQLLLNSDQSLKAKINALKQHVREDLLPLLRSRTILRGLFSFGVMSFAGSCMGIVLQYMNVRIGWSYEKATAVISFNAVMHIIMLAVVLPAFHLRLSKRYETEQANLMLSKISTVFDILGTLVFGVSTHVAGVFLAILLATLGIGFGGALKAFMTSLVPQHDIVLLYTMIGISSAVGSILGAPILQYTFSVGIKTGGMMLGLPYFIAAILFAVSAMGIWTIKVKPVEIVPPTDEYTDESSDGMVV